MTPQQPICILICALGGEGGGVLAEWLYQAAVRAGHHAQATSIPGVAQRTGATTYYVEVQPQPGGRRPVFSLNPVPGEIDLLLSSELLETARHVGNGLCSRERTLLISSTARALTVAEKMQMGDGRLDGAALVAVLQQHARAAELLDLNALARQAGTAISAVLLGAAAASGALPFASARSVCEDVIRASGKGVEASLRGFALAFDAVSRRRAQQAVVEAAVAATMKAAPAPDLRTLARQRLVDYQDARYAELFDQRLARIEALDRGVADELVRWLALWMAFDDIVRVAAAKLAASRLQRVQREVGLKDGELLKVYDHFKPGVPEFAALLPQAQADRLSAWDRRRVAAGREPWALPLKIGTHTVAGTLALRLLASLKAWRRRGSRFALEQRLIEQWLAAVERGTRTSPALGLELARCGRLVKGYGSTNERGKANLLHITEHLSQGPADAVRAAREAALADDAGRGLDDALSAHGAPRRPPREQPVRWFQRRPAAGASPAVRPPA
ncbi:MAG: indolepyruvate oxidoreductase subunit beta family protein [Proteobacteria bacterium]|nr:indolepyruvate oxidoreductase subunit beta family protein [Pseudomonadota bacterium]